MPKKIRSRSLDKLGSVEMDSPSRNIRSQSVERCIPPSISDDEVDMMDCAPLSEMSLENLAPSLKEVYDLIPSVLEVMKRIGKLDTWVKFHKCIT